MQEGTTEKRDATWEDREGLHNSYRYANDLVTR